MDKHYNLNSLQDAAGNALRNPSKSNLENLRMRLNNFFSDSECEEIIYTKNLDRLFFGMCVMAYIPASDHTKVLLEDKPYRIKKYSIEIDSKLSDLDLNDRELTAILLHEVGHLVNDSTPVEKSRQALDLYLSKHNSNIDINNGIINKQILIYAINDSIRKMTSIFNKKDDEILADEFVFMCGYGEDLESAFKKIIANTMNINKYTNTGKLVQLEWALRVYVNMGISRLSAIKTLNRCKLLSGSELEKREIDKVIRDINNPNKSVNESYVINEFKSNNSLITRVQRKGLRALEDDYYQYQIKIKNVDSEDESLLILRQINNRMSILDDYINNLDEDKDEYLIDKYYKLHNKYNELREILIKKSSYNKNMYGLFIDYGQFSDSNR